MKKIIIALLLFASCNEYQDKSCSVNYIGTFRIDSNLVIDPLEKKMIIQFGWDTVKLISSSDGSYRFNSIDKVLNNSQGIWYTKSDNLEAECHGYIKQNNEDYDIPLTYFDITVYLSNGNQIVLPFRK